MIYGGSRQGGKSTFFKMIKVVDFIIVRFYVGPYGFMKVGPLTLKPWLRLRNLAFTEVKNRVFFELPEEFKRYEVITPTLCQELSPLVSEVKHQLAAISWTNARKFRTRLTETELRCLAEIGVPLIL